MQEDSKQVMGEILETETSGKDQSQLSKDLLVAFEHAQSNVKDGEQPSRQLMRFTFDLMRAFISRLAVQSANAYENVEDDSMNVPCKNATFTKEEVVYDKQVEFDGKGSKSGPDK